MLNNIDLKKRIVISLIFFGISLALFSIAVFAFQGHPFQGSVLINYTILSLVIGAYVFGIMHYQFNFAFILFIGGYIFAFVILLYNATRDFTGFLELAGLISWFVIMGLVITAGISFEFLLKTRRANKELIEKAKEAAKTQEAAEKAIDVEYTVVNQNDEDINA